MRWIVLALLALRASAEDRGKHLFEKRCTGCHTLDQQRAGPRLRGVYGRKAGTAVDFPYSDELRKSGIVWNAEALERWLTDPEQLVPGTDMALRMTNAGERAAIIEYLKKAR